MKDAFKIIAMALTIKIVNQIFHLINLETALTTGFCLEFYNSTTFRTQPLFTILSHHASDTCGFYSFGAVQCIQVMPFDILFGVLFHERAWKLAAASAVAEIFGIKTSLYLALQTGLTFTVIANQTSCTWILIFFTADAIYSAWCK